MLTRIIIAWLGNLVDTIATVYLYTNDLGTEINPISVFLLKSPIIFVAVKMVVMTVAVAAIWSRRDHKFFRAASWILSVEYLLVALYYLVVWPLFF